MTEQEANLLYIAVTTDTGCFQYANTNAATLRAAARLLELGADNRKISMDFFRKISRARMALVGQIYSGMRFFRGGQVAIAVVTRALIDSVHATEDDCDDIAGLPGRAEGAVVSVTIRELPTAAARSPCARTRGGFVRDLRGLRRRRPQDGLRLHTRLRHGDGRGENPCSHRPGVARMNGILLVDKPADWTSHDVVAKLRGVLGERRMGHSGTLDPMATGLLVVFAGRATRAVSFSENHSKCYEARLRLGLTTDTQDTTGTVLSRCDRRVTRAELEAALPQFRGDILQVPPMYSALKVDGQKLYEIARRGGEVRAQNAPDHDRRTDRAWRGGRGLCPARPLLEGHLHPHRSATISARPSAAAV